DRVIALGVSAERITVIPNGVPEPAESQSVCDSKGASSTRALLTVSRLVPRKGHDMVLRALPSVIERFPEVIYRIVGDGPERPRLESLARELRIEGFVEFFGTVTESEKEQLIKDCEIFVL